MRKLPSFVFSPKFGLIAVVARNKPSRSRFKPVRIRTKLSAKISPSSVKNRAAGWRTGSGANTSMIFLSFCSASPQETLSAPHHEYVQKNISLSLPAGNDPSFPRRALRGNLASRTAKPVDWTTAEQRQRQYRHRVQTACESRKDRMTTPAARLDWAHKTHSTLVYFVSIQSSFKASFASRSNRSPRRVTTPAHAHHRLDRHQIRTPRGNHRYGH
jgi:hypothetical protein